MLRLRETSSHPSMKGATINLLLILNSASTMLKRAPPEIVWVMLSPSGRGIPLRAGSPRCCNERRPGSGSPPPHGPLHHRSNGHPRFADPLRPVPTAPNGRASPGPPRRPRPCSWGARGAGGGDYLARPASPPFVSRGAFPKSSPTRKPEGPLKEPLTAKEERSGHAGVRDAQSDAPFAQIVKILLIQQVDHIEPQQKFLLVGQWNDMRDGQIIRRVGWTMRGIGLGPGVGRTQSGPIQIGRDTSELQ